MSSSKFIMSYASSTFLTLADIRRITQASVFVADQVLLPTTIQISPDLTKDEHSFILLRLRELHEIQAVGFWEIEGQPSFLTKRYAIEAAKFPDQVISYERYKTIAETIDDRLMQQRDIFLGKGVTSYDGITEIALGKQTMWKFAIAKSLGADRLLLDQKNQSTMHHFFSDLTRYQEFESLVIERIANKLDLPDISQLSVADIESCRQYMPAFRTKIMETTKNQYNEIFLEYLVEEIANAIVNEFFDLLQSNAHNPKIVKIFGKPMLQPTDLAKEVAWDLLQMLFAPIIAAKYAWLFFKWFPDSSETVPLLLLIHLKKIK